MLAASNGLPEVCRKMLGHQRLSADAVNALNKVSVLKKKYREEHE